MVLVATKREGYRGAGVERESRKGVTGRRKISVRGVGVKTKSSFLKASSQVLHLVSQV